MTAVFIFSKAGKIKALGIDGAKEKEKSLIKQGWKHTSTLDACRFLEHLHNDSEYDDLLKDVKELSI